MQLKSYDDIDEKIIEVILNFKPTSKFDQSAQAEILDLQYLIKKEINQLPREGKEIFELRYFQNLSLAEIEKRTSKSQKYISKIISSALGNIKEKIKRTKKGFPLKEELKIIKSDETEAKKAAQWLSGFLSIVFLIAVSLFCYFLIQKSFVPQLAYLKKFSYELKNYLKENLFISNLVQSTSQKQIYKSNPNKIRISGSTSLNILSKKWNKDFKKNYPAYKISLMPSDSDIGISALIEGKIDIANSSRPVTFSDEQKARQKGFDLQEYRIALDALVIIVNTANPIQELSLDDLKNIFTQEAKIWRELGSSNLEIVPVVREEGSGTNEFVENRILQGLTLVDSILKMKSSNEIIKFVSNTRGAIGFINSTNYPWNNNQIKFLKVKTYEDSLSISPYEDKKLNEQAIRYGDYPLAHYLYLITVEPPGEKVDDYINWVLSSEGQKIVSKLGLLPVVE